MNKVLHIILYVALGLLMIACNQPNPSHLDFNADTDSVVETTEGAVDQPISSLEIDWVTGPIQLLPADDSVVTFNEKSDKQLTAKTVMYHHVTPRGKLEIQYCKDEVHAKGKNLPKKALTVYIPRSLKLDKVEINGVGGTVLIDSVQCEKLTVDGVSFDITAHLEVLPEEIECDGVSQQLHLYAPEGSKVYAEADGVKAQVINELGNYSNGAQCHISADGVDVKVEVRTNK